MARTGQFREALTRLSRRFNALQRGEKRCFGVTMPQCLALELLHQEGPRTVRGLADGLGLETSSATRLVDGLARDG
ncbi:MAG: MarR family winged helix-turn-helix transcriptional regulator, partial [Planctomycetota bacterium]